MGPMKPIGLSHGPLQAHRPPKALGPPDWPPKIHEPRGPPLGGRGYTFVNIMTTLFQEH